MDAATSNRTPSVATADDDTRLRATLQNVSGGTWGGCVFDADEIARVIAAGRRALSDVE